MDITTVDTTQAPQDIISPNTGRYQEQYIWTLDKKTLRPVSVRKEVTPE